MVLLKAAAFQEETGKKEIFNISDIAAEARALIESARREREKILASARQEAEGIRQQARKEGFDKGYPEGLAQGQEKGFEQACQEARQEFQCQSENLIQELSAALAQFDQIKHGLVWQAEQDTVALALCIAEKVIKDASMLHREIAAENIKQALAMISRNTDVVIRVNARDEEYLGKIAAQRDQVLGHYGSIRFEPDETVEPGGCVICTENGLVDGQLDTQIQRIAGELLMKKIES
jgi:flagellar assembly protein FliH